MNSDSGLPHLKTLNKETEHEAFCDLAECGIGKLVEVNDVALELVLHSDGAVADEAGNWVAHQTGDVQVVIQRSAAGVGVILPKIVALIDGVFQ